jgi:hypothetical protein
MRYRINEQMVLLCMPKQGPDGPIAPYLHSFAQSLTEQGYWGCYLRRQLMLGACFSHWLKQRRIRSHLISSAHRNHHDKRRTVACRVRLEPQSRNLRHACLPTPADIILDSNVRKRLRITSIRVRREKLTTGMNATQTTDPTWPRPSMSFSRCIDVLVLTTSPVSRLLCRHSADACRPFISPLMGCLSTTLQRNRIMGGSLWNRVTIHRCVLRSGSSRRDERNVAATSRLICFV